MLNGSTAAKAMSQLCAVCSPLVDRTSFGGKGVYVPSRCFNKVVDIPEESPCNNQREEASCDSARAFLPANTAGAGRIA